jgi:hypothetical protein
MSFVDAEAILDALIARSSRERDHTKWNSGSIALEQTFPNKPAVSCPSSPHQPTDSLTGRTEDAPLEWSLGSSLGPALTSTSNFVRCQCQWASFKLLPVASFTNPLPTGMPCSFAQNTLKS